MSSSGPSEHYDGVSDRELATTGRADVLHARVLKRTLPEAQEICRRLVGMGRCASGCPDACPELNTVGVELVEREFAESMTKERFTEKGFLRVVLVDDDFRRLWNERRDIIAKVLTNKLLRSGKPTGYGSRFATIAADDPTLSLLGTDDMTRLKVAESWLRNLWDDACDNAEMDIDTHPGGSEAVYRHPSRFLDDDTWSRYGFRIDRIQRRRISGEHEAAIDAAMDPSLRPAGTDREALLRTRRVCEALLAAVEKTDEVYETFEDAPSALAELEEPRKQLDPLNISSRFDEEYLQLSADDLDRFSDGVVDNKNARTLFDDFYDAWHKSRRPDGMREVSIETPIGEGIYLKDVIGGGADESYGDPDGDHIET